MRFNPIIWSVLVYAYDLEHPDARQSLIDYAAACDASVEFHSGGVGSADIPVIVPNPIPHY